MCGQADKNVQLPVRPRGLIDVRRKFNLLLCPIVICRLTVKGGDKLPQPKISRVFKVHLSLFSLLNLFINHLTLSN